MPGAEWIDGGERLLRGRNRRGSDTTRKEDESMRRVLAGSLSLSLGLVVAGARGQDFQWRPATPPAATQPARSETGVALGRPVVEADADPAASPTFVDRQLLPASFAAPDAAPQPVVRGQMPDTRRPMPPGPPAPGWGPQSSTSYQAPAPPPPPPPGVAAPMDERYNCGVVAGGVPPAGAPLGAFDPLAPPCPAAAGAGCAARCWFQSDHCFDNFISPVTNPFLFEDPRSLTELRRVFIHQATPTSNPIFHGGDIDYFGLQARLAITERWSIVMSEFGALWIEPHNHFGEFGDHVGLSELRIGPKYTFLRNEQCGTLAAVGLQIDAATGSAKVFQDTGSLSLVPYVSFGQNFGRSQWGSFNFLGTLGYSAAVDNKRSDYLFTSLHLDYDIANLHKIYPLVELNWFHYTSGGHTRDLGFEGRDLINFGSTGVNGTDNLSLAVGARYKFSECYQLGAAFEVPVNGRKDLMDYRVTVDFIWRY
jgi:hypothetical protein